MAPVCLALIRLIDVCVCVHSTLSNFDQMQMVPTAKSDHGLGLFRRFKIPDASKLTTRTRRAQLTGKPCGVTSGAEKRVRKELVGSCALFRTLFAAPGGQSLLPNIRRLACLRGCGLQVEERSEAVTPSASGLQSRRRRRGDQKLWMWKR